MPTLRGISIALQSQYDALSIPEYTLSGHAIPDPYSLASEVATPSASGSGNTGTGEEHDTIDVQVPVYQSSQFWVSCSCPPPSSDGSFRFWSFKLFIGSQCLVSWGTSERENWSGKTMFALYDGGTDFERRRVVEKRGLFFPDRGSTRTHDGVALSIKVFRSVARKREKASIDAFDPKAYKGAGIK